MLPVELSFTFLASVLRERVEEVCCLLTPVSSNLTSECVCARVILPTSSELWYLPAEEDLFVSLEKRAILALTPDSLSSAVIAFRMMIS